MRKLWVVLAFSLISIVLTSCGEKRTYQAPPPATSTEKTIVLDTDQRQYRREVSEIFSRQATGYSSVFKRASTSPSSLSQDQTIKLYKELSPVYKRTGDALKRINAPKEVAGIHRRLIKAQYTAAKDLSQGLTPSNTAEQATLWRAYNARGYAFAQGIGAK